MFFRLLPRQANLSDANNDLCLCWEAIKKHPDQLIKKLKEHRNKHSEEYFYEVREKTVQRRKTNSLVRVAARLIYLNKTCYNGLYRVNRSGQFNAPFGNYKSPRIVDANNIWACHHALSHAKIDCRSFKDINPKKGDFVYADPPYEGAYSQYTQEGFNHEQQIALRDAALKWHAIGAKVLLSNASSAVIKDLYGQEPFVIRRVSAPRPINSDKNGRSRKAEFLIRTWK